MTQNDTKRAIFFNLQFYIQRNLRAGYDLTVSVIAEEYARRPSYFNFIIDHSQLIADMIDTEKYRLNFDVDTLENQPEGQKVSSLASH